MRIRPRRANWDTGCTGSNVTQFALRDPNRPGKSFVLFLFFNFISKGDEYVVDLGAGFPSFSAIRMDFASESRVFKDSFCTYKLVKKPKSLDEEEKFPTYERWQKVTSGRPIPVQDYREEDNGWFR